MGKAYLRETLKDLKVQREEELNIFEAVEQILGSFEVKEIEVFLRFNLTISSIINVEVTILRIFPVLVCR